MSEELIDYGTRKIARRPSMYSEEVAQSVFDSIKQDLADALGCDAEQLESSRASFIEAAIREAQDGYKMARYLDDYCNWRCDRNIVEILDDAPWQKAHNDLVEQWRNYWKLEPLFKVGDKVNFRCNAEQLTSTIAELENGWRPASYTMAPLSGDSGSYIVRWEDCQEARHD